MTYSKRIIHEMLVSRAKNNDRDHTYLHPSAIGGCPRAIALQMKGVPGEEDYGCSTLEKFDVGHNLHARLQAYFRDAGLCMTDIAVKIEHGMSKVAKGKERIIVTGKSGRIYPFRHGEKVCKVGFDSVAPWNRISDLKVGDEWFLVEVPFENEAYNMAGNVDGLVMDNETPTVLEIKSINDKGFWYLFFEDELIANYKNDRPNDKECHICGKKMGFGQNMASHLVEVHRPLGKAQEKHVIQANAYMNALGVDQAIFWYEDKNNQEVLDVIIPSDPGLLVALEKRCKAICEIVTQGKIPKKPSGYTKDSFSCHYCQYNYFCWSDESQFDTILKGINGKN